jgi:hypothetical protein
MAKKEKIRRNLDLPLQVDERLRLLQDRSDAASLSEVVRRALALYDMATEHIADGGKIILKNKDDTSEVIRLI